MIIKSNLDRLIAIPVIPAMENALKLNLDTLVIMPGINDIDDDVWLDIVKFHQLDKKLKQKITSGESSGKNELELIKVEAKIEKIDETGKKKIIKEETSNIENMPAEVAGELVDECYDVKTLKKWKNKESRADIRSNIDDRLKDIENGKDNKKIGKIK